MAVAYEPSEHGRKMNVEAIAEVASGAGDHLGGPFALPPPLSKVRL